MKQKIDGSKQLSPKLNAKFQREARRDRKKQTQYECIKVEEYNRRRKTRDLFKKIRNSRSQFVARNGTLLDRNEKQPEEIKNRWKEYAKELYKRDFNMRGTLEYDEHEPEPAILESKVR